MTRQAFTAAIGAVFALIVSASALPAAAGEAVELRAEPVSHGIYVTLGDLFDGVDAAAGKVQVSRAPATGLQAVLEASRIQMIARNVGLDWGNTTGLHRIIVTSGPAETGAGGGRPLHAHASRRHADQTLVYARNIMMGEILGAADLEWSDDAVAASDSLGNPDLAVGKSARRPLRAGAAAVLHDLDSPKVVHRGDMVDVAYESDGVRLILEAKAMSDAAVGDTIDVVNPQSKKTLQAVASAPGQAVVGPEAERLRAAAYMPSLRTASLR